MKQFVCQSKAISDQPSAARLQGGRKKVKGSRKLLDLKIDIGGEVKRAVAGIAEFYNPEDLNGKLVIVVTNLQPKKIFGIESEVMILAAFTGENLAILQPDKEIPPGTQVT